MGEIADMMLDGTMDPETGEFNYDGEDGPGFPQTGAEAEAYKRACGLNGVNRKLSKNQRKNQRKRRNKQARREAEEFERLMAEEDTTTEIYLASRFSRAPQMLAVKTDLEAAGFAVTSRWINAGHHMLDRELSDQAADVERARFAEEDRMDLFMADTIIAFTEEPRETNTRGGRHVEFGLAVAWGHRTIVVGPRENVFYHLGVVEHFDTWPEALAHLVSNREHPVLED